MAAFLLVGLDRVKQALKIDTTDDDDFLRIMIAAASETVARYLKSQAADLLGTDSPPVDPPEDLSSVDPRVVASIIMLVGYLYREPDSDTAKDFELGLLPPKVTIMLYPLRDPTVA